MPIDNEAAFGKINGRRQDLVPAQLAKALQCRRQTSDRPGHRDGAIADDIAVSRHRRIPHHHGRRIGVEGVVRNIDVARHDPLKLIRLLPFVGRHMDDHEAATAEAAHPWFDRIQGHGRGHGGIDGVAAAGQHGGAGLGRRRVLSGNDTAFAHNGWLA